MTVTSGDSRSRRRAPAIAAFVVILGALGVLAISLTASSEQGSGVGAVQARHVPAFSRIELAGANVVTVRAGAARSVTVRGDANLVGRVTTHVESGTLTVDQTGSFKTKHAMRVDIRVPSLAALELSGSGVIAATGVEAGRFRVTLSGSGLVRATGAVTRLVVTLAGSGDVQLERLAARDARATVRGSGRIFVAPSHSLDAAIPGTGTIMYRGDPERVTTSVSGTGAVARG
jgi:hypothetical protein